MKFGVLRGMRLGEGVKSLPRAGLPNVHSVHAVSYTHLTLPTKRIV